MGGGLLVSIPDLFMLQTKALSKPVQLNVSSVYDVRATDQMAITSCLFGPCVGFSLLQISNPKSIPNLLGFLKGVYHGVSRIDSYFWETTSHKAGFLQTSTHSQITQVGSALALFCSSVSRERISSLDRVFGALLFGVFKGGLSSRTCLQTLRGE